MTVSMAASFFIKQIQCMICILRARCTEGYFKVFHRQRKRRKKSAVTPPLPFKHIPVNPHRLDAARIIRLRTVHQVVGRINLQRSIKLKLDSAGAVLGPIGCNEVKFSVGKLRSHRCVVQIRGFSKPRITPRLVLTPNRLLGMNTRTLQIEATGDFWTGKLKPKIRLTGQWLERAGFKPGSRVKVESDEPGILTLRVLGQSTIKNNPDTTFDTTRRILANSK